MAEISLTQNQKAIVDDEDFKKVSQYKWHAMKYMNGFRAARNCYDENGKCKHIYLHRFITLEKRWEINS